MKIFDKTKKAGLALLAVLLLLSAVPGARAVEAPEVSAKHALLIDPVSEEVLFERDAHERAYPASITKVMTALLILENGSPDDTIAVTAEALEGLHPDGSSAGLKVGEELTLTDLLHCILVASANDACNVAAAHISGSVGAFVEKMNARAAELGLTGTHFTNPHGLHDENHYTTAFDTYLITREALKHTEFLEICNTASVTIPKTNLSGERYFNTTNHLISIKQTPDYIYPFAKGGKTGHTTPAGYCLVSTAEKNRQLLIAVVMGCVKDEETGKIGSFVDSKTLYEWGFSSFSEKTILDKSEVITEVSVRLAKEKDHLILVPQETVSSLLPNDFVPEEVVRTITVFDEENITAPVERGQALGEIALSYNGRDYGTVPLVAMSSVARDQFLYYADVGLTFLSKPIVKIAIVALIILIIAYFVFLAVLRSKNRSSSNYRGRKRRRR
ncbi:D-alanyl-D-alanine carboxypeptidase [Oscillospiraceae bacterium OttesenSCG-928-G22]|nr:D-alanyl-D-alanine carboxypeptidase [Oscillospiraceae bacterium OttesenSCG-928-G22]